MTETNGASAAFDKYTPWNSDGADVQKTESGLEYIVLTTGDANGVSPTPMDQVVMNYEGRLADGGKKFDSSFDRSQPATFQAGRLIPGWIEALSMMKPGDSWLLYIPSELGYGARGAGGDIPPNADLIFKMDMLDVIKSQTADEEAWNKFTPWPGEASDLKTTESGVEYVVIEAGDATAETAGEEDYVVIHAEGRLAETGDVFISSFMEGGPKRLPAGQPIFGPGWQETIQMMRPGDRWLVKIPYALAFGDEANGPIPAKSDVIFEIDLQQVVDLG